MTHVAHFDNMRSRKKSFCASIDQPTGPAGRHANKACAGQRIIYGIIGTKAVVTSYKLPTSIALAPTAEVIVPRHSTVSRLSEPSATIPVHLWRYAN